MNGRSMGDVNGFRRDQPLPVVLGIIFSVDMDAIARFIAQARERGFEPQLLRLSYDFEAPAQILGFPVIQPVDRLSAQQADALHRQVLDWQCAFAEAGADHDDDAGSITAAAAMLGPFVQVALRAITIVRNAATSLQPAAFACLGVKGDWALPLPLVIAALRRAAPQAVGWNVSAPKPPAFPRLIGWRERASAAFSRPFGLVRGWRRNESASRQDGGDAAPRHIVLVMRGKRGVSWFRVPGDSRYRLIDEYSEGLPEALISACQSEGGRLTIVHEGPVPHQLEGDVPWPDFVSQVNRNAFATEVGSRSAVRVRRAAWVQRVLDDVRIRRVFVLDGVDVLTPNRDHIARMLFELSVQAECNLAIWRRAFLVLSPDVVVGGRLESQPWISRAAHEAGAYVASLKLGVGDEMLLSLGGLNMPAADPLGQPDALLVWGEDQVIRLNKAIGSKSVSVVATGRARSDTFVRARNRIDAAQVRDLLGLPPGKRTILWGGTCRTRWGLWPGHAAGASVLSPESYAAAVQALAAVAARHDAIVLIKAHPADDMALIAGVAETFPSQVFLIENTCDLHNAELLAVTDVFVSSVSSMFAEAVLSDVPSVNVWLPEINLIYENERSQTYARVALEVSSIATMATATERLLTDGYARKSELARARIAMTSLFGKPDGEAAARAAQYCMTKALKPRARIAAIIDRIVHCPSGDGLAFSRRRPRAAPDTSEVAMRLAAASEGTMLVIAGPGLHEAYRNIVRAMPLDVPLVDFAGFSDRPGMTDPRRRAADESWFVTARRLAETAMETIVETLPPPHAGTARTAISPMTLRLKLDIASGLRRLEIAGMAMAAPGIRQVLLLEGDQPLEDLRVLCVARGLEAVTLHASRSSQALNRSRRRTSAGARKADWGRLDRAVAKAGHRPLKGRGKTLVVADLRQPRDFRHRRTVTSVLKGASSDGAALVQPYRKRTARVVEAVWTAFRLGAGTRLIHYSKVEAPRPALAGCRTEILKAVRTRWADQGVGAAETACGLEAVGAFVIANLPDNLALTDAVVTGLRASPPSSVISIPIGSPFGGLVIAGAVAAGARTIEVQTLMIGQSERDPAPTASWLAVLDTVQRDIFVERFMIAPERIVLAGHVDIGRFGGCVEPPHDSRSVLFVSQPLDRLSQVAFRLLVEACAAAGDIRLAVAPHPDETDEDLRAYCRIATEMAFEVEILERGVATAAVADYAILAAIVSNLVLHAAVADRPVLLLEVGVPMPLDFAAIGLGVRVGSVTQAANMVRDFLSSGPAYQKLAQTRGRYFDQNPQMRSGDAVRKILDAVAPGAPLA